MVSPAEQLEINFDFLKLTPKMSITKIIADTSFQSLAMTEAKHGFREASEHSKFFRIGKKDQRAALSQKQREKLSYM